MIVLRNGTVVDGSGHEPFSADLLVEDDRIRSIGRLEAPADAVSIDCTGLTIAPGFIDAHSHSDLQAIEGRLEKVRQGVTTEVVGNCGFSPYPTPHDPSLLHDFANGILCGHGDWGWSGACDYLQAAQRATTNVSSLVGHGTLRIACAGNTMGPLSERDMDRMEAMLDDSLADGACGFSTGLMYAPGSSAPASELERLCRVVARRDAVYTTHMRDYSGGLVEAVEEQITIAAKTGCRLQISHFQAVGQRFWDRQQPALERIEKARADGIDVAFDCYPYVAGATVLTQLLPQWALEGGMAELLARLRGLERARIAEGADAGLAQAWADIYISATGSGNPDVMGRNLVEIGAARGCSPVDAAIELLQEEGGAVNILEFNQSEPNLKQTLTHPLSLIITDGFYVSGRPHPRLTGTFPHLLGEIVRRRGWLTLAEAVHKVTDAPARRFGMKYRGRIEEGWTADLVVFDAERVDSPATYADPELPPVGIHAVFRGGRVQWASDMLDAALSCGPLQRSAGHRI